MVAVGEGASVWLGVGDFVEAREGEGDGLVVLVALASGLVEVRLGVGVIWPG
jgi:hypothetical protein